MRRHGIMALAAVAALSLTAVIDAQKGGGPKVTLVEYPAEITFWNRTTDGVKSDGAVYKNGVNGVKAVFQDNSAGTGSRNFLLNMSRSRGRSLTFDYRTEVVTPCAVMDTEPTGPTGVLTDGGADFWILNIMQMPVGSTIAKQGAFATGVGLFRFHDETKINPIEPYHCAQLMVVTRLSRTQWRVTTDVDPDTVYFNTAGLVVTPGSTVQLDQGDSLRGNYRMAFGADITCPTCQ